MQESSFEEQMRLVLKKYYGYVDEDLKYCSGIMGVPISFLDKFCPEQFEILGLGIANLGLNIGVNPYKLEHKLYRKEVQKRGAVDGDLYLLDKNGNPVVPYARVLVRNKQYEL